MHVVPAIEIVTEDTQTISGATYVEVDGSSFDVQPDGVYELRFGFHVAVTGLPSVQFKLLTPAGSTGKLAGNVDLNDEEHVTSGMTPRDVLFQAGAAGTVSLQAAIDGSGALAIKPFSTILLRRVV
jgi:hypothetical protein